MTVRDVLLFLRDLLVVLVCVVVLIAVSSVP